VVRDLRRQAAVFADGDRLPHAVEDARGVIPLVGDVAAAKTSGDLRERGDFLCGGERSWHVEESRAQAERAVLHPLLDEPLHLEDLVRRGLAVDVPHDL
jgi:hypothetical protein